MLLRKVINPDGTANWFGNNIDARKHAASLGVPRMVFDVQGGDAVADLIMSERAEAVGHALEAIGAVDVVEKEDLPY